MTIQEAIDAMNGILLRSWNTTTCPILWEGVAQNQPTNKPFLRVTIKHASDGVASLPAWNGERIFRRSGTIFVSVFTPITDNSGLRFQLSQNVIDIFETVRDDNVSFENIYPVEIGQSGNFYQINVLIEFNYQDIH